MPKDPRKKYTLTQFQDMLTDELRRFVVFQVKERFAGRPSYSLDELTLEEWFPAFEQFVREEPLGS